MAITVQVAFDAADPRALGRFWALALGYAEDRPPAGFDNWPDALRAMGMPEEKWNDAYAVSDPDSAGLRLYFQRVLEGKTAKNRVHLDVNAGRGIGDSAERARVVDVHVRVLVDAGARIHRTLAEHGERCVVLFDPEGNEFCVQ